MSTAHASRKSESLQKLNWQVCNNLKHKIPLSLFFDSFSQMYPDWQVGDNCWAMWTDGNWYLAVIEAIR